MAERKPIKIVTGYKLRECAVWAKVTKEKEANF